MRVGSAAQISVFSLNCDAAFAEDVNCLSRWLDLQHQICAHRRCHDNFDIYFRDGETARLALNREPTGRHKLEKIFSVRVRYRVSLERPLYASQGEVRVSDRCLLRIQDASDDSTGKRLRPGNRKERHSP